MVMERHPGLRALAEDLAAAEEAVRQASAIENPELEVATEEFGRNEVEVMLTQPIPLGGARGAAIDMARGEADIARLALEGERLTVEAELVRRYVSVISAGGRLALIDSLIQVSSEGVEAVRILVDAGAAMEIDLVRAEFDRDELLLERIELKRSLSAHETSLAELWGDRGFRFDGVSGSLGDLSDVPSLDDLAAAMEDHPAAKLPDAEHRIARAEIDEARAERWPEVALSGGYLKNNEADEGAVLAGIAISLPVFDRKGAALAAGRHRAAAAKHRASLDRLERSTALEVLYLEMETSGKHLSSLSGELLSKATRIHSDLQEFYAHGRTGILDVLEARGHLLEVKMRILDLTEEQALLGADLMELTGYPIEIVR
jgi:cobalt-zinc-cadmium efflux system outer membrane protein